MNKKKFNGNKANLMSSISYDYIDLKIALNNKPKLIMIT